MLNRNLSKKALKIVFKIWYFIMLYASKKRDKKHFWKHSGSKIVGLKRSNNGPFWISVKNDRLLIIGKFEIFQSKFPINNYIKIRLMSLYAILYVYVYILDAG